MNNWSFTGNVGKDSEVRYTKDGDPILSFTVAVKSGFGKNESTTWVNCSMFGKRGETVAPYVIKGTQVGVVGEVNNREWVDKDGVKRLSLDVRVNDLTLLGGSKAKPDDSPQSHAPEDSDSIPF
jgi:single-strand DNA-binding protein